MDPLSVTTSIIAVLQLSGKVVCYLNDIKDASKDHAKCAIEAASLNSLLTTLRFRLEEGSSNTPWYTVVRDLAIKNGPLDQFKQALEELQSKLTGGSKMKRVGDALLWKFKKEEIASILGRMERLKTLVEIALQMDHFKLSQAIKEECSLIQTHVSTIHSGLETIRQDQDDARHGKLVEWMSTTDYPAQQSDIIGRRQEGTGQWFLNAPEFARWLSEPKETLFCPGIPGAGKTMIAAIAIDHLLKTAQSSSVGVSYVYCNYKAQKEQDSTSMLAAILKQLVYGRPSLVEPVEQLHKQHANRGTKPLANEVFAALQSVVAGFSTVHVVVDALDECSNDDGTRRRFLAYIRALQTKFDVRLMATSRSIPEIVGEFEKAAKLEVRAGDEDVRRFVAGQIYRLPNCIQRNSVLRDMVQGKISEAVDGMFLLARLHTDSLLDKRTPKDVKSTLAKLSKGSAALDDAYREAIQRIEGQLPGDNKRAKTVLSWITYAQRPLTTAELCCALAVEPNKQELDPENIPDVEDLVLICAGLVVVDEESAIVRLVHYTTQAYLERIREQWNPNAQLDIASTCLSYLSFDIFRDGSSPSDNEFESRLEQNVFLDYAARYWGQHAAKVQDEVYEQACSFLLDRGLISCAVQVVSSPGYRWTGYSQDHPKNSTCLHIMAQFGLHNLSEAILNRCRRDTIPSVNARDSEKQSALYLAAKYGHESMVKLLLDAGADINAQGGHFGNALQAASYGGHEQTVKLLLDAGADVNAQGGKFGNALQAASLGGHEQTVKLLLDRGVDVNAQGERYGNVLQAASLGGHEQTVKLLLDAGADVNAQGGDFGNTQGGDFGNALQAASSRGHEQIVRLLLDKGADVNAQGGHYGSFLQFLAYKGQTDLLRVLYEQYCADHDLIDSHCRTPLQLAARGGHIETYNYLSGLSLDSNIIDRKGDGLIHYASSGGSLQILSAVLDKQPTFAPQSGHWSPLHWACRGGNPQIVERLVQEGFRGQSIALSQPEGKWSPMSIAIFHGNRKMLEDLSASCRSLLGDIADSVQLPSKHHGSYWCNGCFHSIYGPRFCCRTCMDFDYCFMCKPFLDHLHKNHGWDCIVLQ